MPPCRASAAFRAVKRPPTGRSGKLGGMWLRVRAATTVVLLLIGISILMAGLFYREWPAVVFGVLVAGSSLYILT